MEGYRNSTMYIKRHLETTIEKLNSCFKVLLVTGPRQVGKTTLMRQLQDKLQAQGKTFFHFNLEYENYLNAFNENPLHLFDFVPLKIKLSGKDCNLAISLTVITLGSIG